MPTEVMMPQLGESVVEGVVGRWLIAEGEAIEEYQPLLEVETDKVNTEIPAPASGILLKILVPEGTTVAAGTVLAFIGQLDEPIPEGEDAIPDTTANRLAKSEPSGDEQRRARPSGQSVITPVVSKIAAEHDIDLASVDIRGSGRGGRISKKDILAHIERIKIDGSAVQELPLWEQPGTGELFKPSEEVTPADVTSAPPVSQAPKSETPKKDTSAPVSDQVVPLTSMRQAIAEHMVLSVRTSPHVTTVMEAGMSQIVAYRNTHKAEFEQREGLRLTFTPFLVQAVVEGLKAVPEANSSFSDEGIVLHRQINVGLAVALKSGLIVPVVKDADQLSLSGLQRAVSDLTERAHARQLKPDEVQDSTFTITNHGVSGSLLAMPIINQPNAGILGVGAIQKRPVVVTTEGTDSIAIKPMCYLSFTFDHRIMDGALADRFLALVVGALERWG